MNKEEAANFILDHQGNEFKLEENEGSGWIMKSISMHDRKTEEFILHGLVVNMPGPDKDSIRILLWHDDAVEYLKVVKRSI